MSENVNEMNKVTETTAASTAAADKDYVENFVPRVHRIGRTSMVLGLLLAFLPVIYLYFVRGFKVPVSDYVSVIVAIASIGLGMWLSEQISYWPILGSASLYMACLSGNLSGMRFPVALSVQASMDADINTPRGQIITIVGVAASVFMNLVVLLLIVLAGAWIISILPETVLGAFSFVTASLVGCMFVMRFAYAKEGFAKSLMNNAVFLVIAVAWRLSIDHVFKGLAAYGSAISVGTAILVAYIFFKTKNAAAAKQ